MVPELRSWDCICIPAVQGGPSVPSRFHTDGLIENISGDIENAFVDFEKHNYGLPLL